MTDTRRIAACVAAALAVACAVWLVAVASACATTSSGSSPVAASAANSPEPGPTRLERALVDALAADDAEVRSEALYAMQFVGTRDHVAAIARLLDADDPDERCRALRTLGEVADNDPTARTAVAPHLLRGLRDPSRLCVREALSAFASADPGDWRPIEAFLSSNDWELRLAALNTLLQRDRPVHDNDLAAALHDFAGTVAAYLLTNVLQRCEAPAQRSLLEARFADADPELAFLAREAVTRIDAIAAGVADPRPVSQQERERFDAENRAAETRVAARQWCELAPDQLVAALRDVRLVLFAETHHDGGPLRDAQQRVLRAMAGDRPDLLVLGYEPSVASAQRSVIDLATALGVATRSLEQDWRELCATARHAERDDQAAAAINACLRERPDRRMLVLRGETHCRPDGYLCRQLECPPVIVLNARFPPLRALGNDPRIVDRTFRLGGDGRVFFWGAAELVAPGLRKWLDAHR